MPDGWFLALKLDERSGKVGHGEPSKAVFAIAQPPHSVTTFRAAGSKGISLLLDMEWAERGLRGQ